MQSKQIIAQIIAKLNVFSLGNFELMVAWKSLSVWMYFALEMFAYTYTTNKYQPSESVRSKI